MDIAGREKPRRPEVTRVGRLRLAGVVASGLLVMGLGVAWMAFGQAADARFQVAGWGSEATLQMRRDASAVLLAPGQRYLDPPAGAAREDAYRFDPGTRELRPVPVESWKAATGDVVDCDRTGLAPSRIQVDGGELRVDGRAVPVSGRVRHARMSPDGRFVAVLSAWGIRIPSLSLIPTLGGSAVLGWRYHHVFAIPSGDPVGPSIAIDFGVSDSVPCWGPDGRMVVYADPAFTEVAFVLVHE